MYWIIGFLALAALVAWCFRPRPFDPNSGGIYDGDDGEE